jgi:transcriptional regulator with XRE-family HTH domain
MKRHSRQRDTGADSGTDPGYQDPHGGLRGNRLEISIGREVRRAREQLNLTLNDLAKASKISGGMLSKIENGGTSLSLGSLQALSKALHVPLTSFFRGYEETREATFVKAGEGLNIERRGTRAGQQYQLLGHSRTRPL